MFRRLACRGRRLRSTSGNGLPLAWPAPSTQRVPPLPVRRPNPPAGPLSCTDRLLSAPSLQGDVELVSLFEVLVLHLLSSNKAAALAGPQPRSPERFAYRMNMLIDMAATHASGGYFWRRTSCNAFVGTATFLVDRHSFSAILLKWLSVSFPCLNRAESD